jgi:hypothetical protein
MLEKVGVLAVADAAEKIGFAFPPRPTNDEGNISGRTGRMARRQLGFLLRRLSGLLGSSGLGTDGQLLQRFVAHQEEAAFEALLARYGPLVHGLCRRLLGDVHDADDAFQATFLVLARKANTVRDCGDANNFTATSETPKPGGR